MTGMHNKRMAQEDKVQWLFVLERINAPQIKTATMSVEPTHAQQNNICC